MLLQKIIDKAQQPLIKICGLTRNEDVEFCLRSHVDFTGFIFVKKSPRCISVENAARMPSRKAARVGVFAGMNVDTVEDIMSRAKLDFAQLHGGESVEFCQAIGPERVIKVFWPEQYTSEQEFQEVCEKFAPHCALFLLDAGTSGGGHGKAISEEKLKNLDIPLPWLLAGGISPSNIEEMFRSYSKKNLYGLDVNSGVECSAGIKDQNAITKLLEWRNNLLAPDVR